LYSNSYKKESNEVIYERSLTYREVISIADAARKMEGDTSNQIDFKHDFPNVYCLTKHYAEKLVCDQAGDLPTGIFRPPIIGPSYKRIPGWTDNLNGLTGFFVIMFKGLVHTFLGNEENPGNYAPVDYCVNALVAVAWDVSEKFMNTKDEKTSIPIYNYMFEKNNLSIKKTMELVSEGFHAPLEGSIYYYSFLKSSSPFWFNVFFFLFTSLPAFITDTFSVAFGKKPKFFKISKKLKTMMVVFSPFLLIKFKFGNENLKNLLSKVKKMQGFRDELDFDYECIDWNEYFQNFQPGIKKYFFKEDMSKCEELSKSYQQ
jgi:alcohol-forming fatty acyl-CoA reductase